MPGKFRSFLGSERPVPDLHPAQRLFCGMMHGRNFRHPTPSCCILAVGSAVCPPIAAVTILEKPSQIYSATHLPPRHTSRLRRTPARLSPSVLSPAVNNPHPRVIGIVAGAGCLRGNCSSIDFLSFPLSVMTKAVKNKSMGMLMDRPTKVTTGALCGILRKASLPPQVVRSSCRGCHRVWQVRVPMREGRIVPDGTG